MSQVPLRFSVQVTADPQDPAKRFSGAFKLPGVRLTGTQTVDGIHADGPILRDGALVVPSDGAAIAFATLEVPGDLVPQSALDEQKFSLEKEKARSEDANRRRTLLWSAGSAVLTAVVTLGVAYINKGGDAKPSAGGAPADAVQACRASLKRLPLLARANGQTVQALAEAIDRHEADCDEVLVKTLGTR
jgi:hypothetical protein